MTRKVKRKLFLAMALDASPVIQTPSGEARLALPVGCAGAMWVFTSWEVAQAAGYKDALEIVELCKEEA